MHHGPGEDPLFRPKSWIGISTCHTIIDPHGEAYGTIRQPNRESQRPRLLNLPIRPSQSEIPIKVFDNLILVITRFLVPIALEVRLSGRNNPEI
jgi:hypothetical protein